MGNAETDGEVYFTPGQRRQQQYQQPLKTSLRKRKRDDKGDRAISHDRVILVDLANFMVANGIDKENVQFIVPEKEEVDVTIFATSSTGEGIGRVDEHSSQVFVVPFAVKGDVAHVKAYRHITRPVPHTLADFISAVTPSPDRDDSLIRCKYFAKCGGCQYQMLPYDKQLVQKRTVVEKAFQNFSQLPPELVPAVEQTHASPLQYAFRTKLTPHFDGPPGSWRKKNHFTDVPPVGFQRKDTGKTMDIEECPIASEVLQYGLKRERQRVFDDLHKYTKGATILLRESTVSREPNEQPVSEPSSHWDTTSQTLYEHKTDYTYGKQCISDHKGTSSDYIDDFKLSAPANSFFQNNNSILPSFIDYVRQQITRPPGSSSDSKPRKFTNLIDAYCGSGLFSITLAPLFSRTIGIDIDSQSITSAHANLKQNAHLVPEPQRFRSSSADVHPAPGQQESREDDVYSLEGPKLTAVTKKPETITGEDGKDHEFREYNNHRSLGIHFIAADAGALFESVQDFDPAETVVILDPPRKGCDEQFLRQLIDFAPERIVYVSCNVHTQARDVGWLLRGGKERPGWNGRDATYGADPANGLQKDELEDRMYDIESLKGFDFFPQTAHVEGVAVLSKRTKNAEKVEKAEKAVQVETAVEVDAFGIERPRKV